MIETQPPFLLSAEELRHADSAKWTHYLADVLPLWVADMDFAIAPSIAQALTERLKIPIGYGLVFGDPVLGGLLRQKLERMGFDELPEKDSIHFITGVVQGIYAGVAALTEPGDEVLTMTPIYPPFLTAIADQQRVARHAMLKQNEAGWVIDWDEMERARTPRTKLLLLCHPHNPTGRVWTVAELTQIAHFAEQHGMLVVCDELHADLTLDGPFVPFVKVASKELRERTITLTGPCKTYNTAGLGIGAMVSHEPALIQKAKKTLGGLGGHCGALNITMWRAALRDDGQWLRAVLDQLRTNRQTLDAFVKARLPGVKFTPPQATYLAWLDYRAHPRAGDIFKYLLDTAKVALNDGPPFGPGYQGYVRLNFATSPTILNEALERLAGAHSI